jgi:hypothetical protein
LSRGGGTRISEVEHSAPAHEAGRQPVISDRLGAVVFRARAFRRSYSPRCRAKSRQHPIPHRMQRPRRCSPPG